MAIKFEKTKADKKADRGKREGGKPDKKADAKAMAKMPKALVKYGKKGPC